MLDDSPRLLYKDDEMRWYSCCKKNGGDELNHVEHEQEMIAVLSSTTN